MHLSHATRSTVLDLFIPFRSYPLRISDLVFIFHFSFFLLSFLFFLILFYFFPGQTIPYLFLLFLCWCLRVGHRGLHIYSAGS